MHFREIPRVKNANGIVPKLRGVGEVRGYLEFLYVYHGNKRR
jgi:hypothetical protein